MTDFRDTTVDRIINVDGTFNVTIQYWWLLMNKRKVRSVLSVIYNIIGVLGTIAMFVFLPLNAAICFSGFLDFPLIILNVISYQNYVQRYPLNDLNEYKIDLKKDDFTKYDELRDIYYIVLENDKGFYKTIDCEKKLIFDMTRFFMPKTYLRSYFIRNIHFKIINKDHLPLSYLSKSQRVSLKFKYILSI